MTHEKDFLHLDVETPYLAVDLDDVLKRYDALVAALPNAAVHYAMKCNPDDRILLQIRGRGGSFEIASFNELQQLIDLDVEPSEVLFSNPVKAPEHIRKAFNAGVRRFAFDSEAEIEKLAKLAPGSSVYVRVATSSFGSEVHSEGKFGVSVSRSVALMQSAVGRGLQPYGLSFHVGSQNVHLEAWDSALARAGDLMRALGAAGIRIAAVDVGGGFPVDYAGDEAPDITEHANAILRGAEKYLPYEVELIVEPGRYLVATAGVFVATVIGIARRGQVYWAHLDLGAFNGMMEALETANELHFPVTDDLNSVSQKLFNLTGPSCDSQDTILFGVPLSSDLAVGDRVFIHNAGAYTTSYSSRFNGFDLPLTYCMGGEELAPVITIEDAIDLTAPAKAMPTTKLPSKASSVAS